MGPRNLLILFFSTVAVSLVILIIFFSLFFKNVDLNFNTRLPETAPDIGRNFPAGASMNPESKAEGVQRSTVNVPPEVKEPEVQPESQTDKKTTPPLPPEGDVPPVSDDALLDNTVAPDAPEPLRPLTETYPGETSNKAQPGQKQPPHTSRKPEMPQLQAPVRQSYPEQAPASSQAPLTLPPEKNEPSPNNPPVPGQ